MSFIGAPISMVILTWGGGHRNDNRLHACGLIKGNKYVEQFYY